MCSLFFRAALHRLLFCIDYLHGSGVPANRGIFESVLRELCARVCVCVCVCNIVAWHGLVYPLAPCRWIVNRLLGRRWPCQGIVSYALGPRICCCAPGGHMSCRSPARAAVLVVRMRAATGCFLGGAWVPSLGCSLCPLPYHCASPIWAQGVLLLCVLGPPFRSRGAWSHAVTRTRCWVGRAAALPAGS